MPRYLTTRELSSHLRCSEKTIRRHVAAGRLPASQFTDGGRFLFDVREVRNVIRRHRKTPPAGEPAASETATGDSAPPA